MGAGDKNSIYVWSFFFYFLMSQMSVPMAKCPTFFSEVPQAAQQKHSPCRGRPKVTLGFTVKIEF